MFSGLTNQVSNWMGKKGEDGVELPSEEKIDPTTVEGDSDLEKKDASQAGSKLEMLAGVKSQMTGWLSGGIPGLSRGAAGAEGETPAVPAETNETQVSQQNVQGSSPENVKDDDASRWASHATSGADSGPVSLGGTPTEDKDAQAFGAAAVSTKAIAGAKSLGGFLYSAVNKAGKTVVEASVKIKKTVEENRLIAELNKEQEAFIASKQNEKGEAVAPWVGAPNEDALREECLSLSTDRRNFQRPPPPGVEFEWDFEAIQPMAQAALALDPNLEAMRFELVPKFISEENFWRNYFYRVSLLRQSHELNAMASQQEQQQSESNPNQTLTSTDSVDNSQVQAISSQGVTTTSDNSNTLTDSPGHEFVSDSMRVSDTDLEEVREGMKKLGMQPPKEEDWEHELEAELKDFEVVSDVSKATSLTENKRTDSEKGADDWEKRIDDLLATATEDDEDLK